MRFFGLFLSIILHAALVAAALFWTTVPDRPVNLERPVYSVDIVTLAPPGPPPPPGRSTLAKTDATPVPKRAKPEPEAVEVEKPAPKPEPKPQSKVEPKPEPEPEAKKISEEKKERKVVVKKKKPEPKPEPKPKPKPKPEPKPEPKPKPKPKPTSDELLADALKDVQQDVSAKERKKEQDLANELASLRKEEGEQIYSHGGEQGGGGAVGGTGSGLAQVYAMIVASTIKQNWRYPAFAGDANLLVSVEITIDDAGKITGSRVVDSSDDAEFDNSALRAIRETEAVEPPRTDRDKTIVINFNSQDLNQ